MEIKLHKISVITVCLNAVDVINVTISSVLNQTYPNIEYIIIDGGSVDGTIEFLNNYQEQNHLKYISEPDSGIYEAMNKGIKRASGDLLIFLNAGDRFITDHALEYAISKFNQQHTDIFFGRIIWECPADKSIVLSQHQFVVYEWDLKRSNFPHPATIYKRELFTELGLFDESFKILADYEWNARALLKSRKSFQYFDIAISIFRADGISNNTSSASIVQQETNIIFQRYFKRGWLFSLIEEYVDGSNKNGNRYKEKILARLFKKKLNRVY